MAPAAKSRGVVPVSAPIRSTMSRVLRVAAIGRCHTSPAAAGAVPRVIRAAATSGVYE